MTYSVFLSMSSSLLDSHHHFTPQDQAMLAVNVLVPLKSDWKRVYSLQGRLPGANPMHSGSSNNVQEGPLQANPCMTSTPFGGGGLHLDTNRKSWCSKPNIQSCLLCTSACSACPRPTSVRVRFLL